MFYRPGKNLISFYPKALQLLAAAFGAFIYWSILLTLIVRWIPPPTSSFMLQRSLHAWWNNEQQFQIHYEWVDWQHISPYVKVAAVTSEDQNFASHWGFDLQAIQKAIREHQQGEELRGASTITQQVAKNLFLWPGQSYFRKAMEAYFTILIELIWTKKRILEVYLNIAEFGDGVYGVKTAAEIYFNTKPANLTMIQSALMITALPSPKRYDLSDPSPYMIERRNWILQYMFYLGNSDYLEKIE